MIELRDHIEKLSSEDEADRIYAAEDIGYANQRAGVDPLLARLPEEPSRAVRVAIFGALQQIEDDAVIQGALVLLDSEDSFLRNQSVEILRTRGAKVIPYLDRAFRDGDTDRRKFVIDVLARVGDDGAAAIYDRALNDPDLNVSITTVESLGKRRKAAFRERIEGLVSAGAHPMLLCACLEALAQIGDETSVDIVRSRLDPAVGMADYLRPFYLELLGAKGRPEDVVEVAELMSQGNLEEPVLNALTALRNRYPGLKFPGSLAEPLREIVSRNESPVRAYNAMRLLGGLLDDPAVFGFVERSLGNPEKSLRIGAGQALREMETVKATAALDRRLAWETDEEVMQAWAGKSAR